MITENLSTLKIHKLTQEQYNRELATGNIDENALYLTPDEGYSKEELETILDSKADSSHTHDTYETKSDASAKLTEAKEYTDTKADELTEEIKNQHFYVTVTANEDGTYSADKTFEELSAAHEEGKILYCTINDGADFNIPCLGGSSEVGMFIFSANLGSSATAFTIDSDNNVAFESAELVTEDMIPTVDNVLKEGSYNPISNDAVTKKFEEIESIFDSTVTYENNIDTTIDGTTVHTGWLRDNNDELIAPYTLGDNIFNNDGTNFSETLKSQVLTIVNDFSDTLNNHKNDTDNPHEVTKSQVGLGNVDNTSDVDKPVSTAQQTAIDTALATAKEYTDTQFEEIDNGVSELISHMYGDDLGDVAPTIREIANDEANKALSSANTYTDGQIEDVTTSLDTHTGNADIHVTSANKTNWNSAYTHSTSAHAPSTAEKNVIVGIQKNGTDLTVNSSTRKVNITVPTTAAEIGAEVAGAANTALNTAKSYTDTEVAEVQTNLDTHAENADIHFTAAERTKLAGIATGANKYSHPASGVTSGIYNKVTVNSQGHVTGGSNPTTLSEYGITDAESKTDASAKLDEAKEYTDEQFSTLATQFGGAIVHMYEGLVDDDTLTPPPIKDVVDVMVWSEINNHDHSATAHDDIRSLITKLTTRLNALADSDDTTLDQLSEIVSYIKSNRDLIDSITTSKINVSDIVDNLTTSSTSKVLSAKQGVVIKALIDALQAELDSHGTHVSYSTTAPVMDGTAAVGTAATVARSDHKHPTDTSRASKTEFDTHVADTTKHITATERTNWKAAKTHADSAHAPSNAQANQNAFSNVKVGDTTIAADTTTDTLELVGSNVTITPDATNDKVTIAVADGSTSTAGILKLTNSTSSTSTTTAATPASVKSAYDLANTAKTNAATAQTKADSAYTLAEGKVDSLSDLGITATAAELNYMDGVTSNIQTQLNDAFTRISNNNTSILNMGLELDSKSNTDHTHDYLPLSGGTITGPLTLPNFICKPPGWAFASVKDSEDKTILNWQADSTNHVLIFDEYTTDTSYYERYSLPTPSTGRTENGHYKILTNKNAVTIAQGGTGATTASAALANLGALPLSGGTLTGALTVSSGGVTVSSGDIKINNGIVRCNRSTEVNSGFQAKNSLRDGLFYVNTTGNLGIYDNGNAKWVIRSDTDGNVYLPTGTVSVSDRLKVDRSSGAYVAAVDVINNVRSGALYLSGAGNLGIFDNTNSEWVMRSDTSKNIYFPSAPTVQITNGLRVDGNFSALGDNSTISWKLMDSTGSVQLRRSGDSTSYRVSFVYTDTAGSAHFTHLYDTAGNFMLAPYYYLTSYDRVTRVQMSSDDNLIPLTADGSTYTGKCCLGSTDHYWKSVYYSGSLTKQSDRRIKNIIGDLSEENALALLKGSEIKAFTYKTDEDNILHYGVIAQDVRDLLISSGIGYNSLLSIGIAGTEKNTTNIYMEEDKVRYSIDYTQYTPFLIKGWQNHDGRIENHETRLQVLERENAELKTKIANLEALM